MLGRILIQLNRIVQKMIRNKYVIIKVFCDSVTHYITGDPFSNNKESLFFFLFYYHHIELLFTPSFEKHFLFLHEYILNKYKLIKHYINVSVLVYLFLLSTSGYISDILIY